MSGWRTLAALGALAAAIPAVQARLDARGVERRDAQERLYLWSGEQIRKICPGFENLMADIYWLRTVQYFGHQHLYSDAPSYELLYPLIDITTTLDPRLEIAYRYGAIFLCEPKPTGKGDCQAGLAVLEKGTRALPNSWSLRQYQGYFRYIFLDDPQGAARILLEAARLPGAPFWLESLSAAILTQGGDRETARTVWRRMYEQAEEGVIRENARYNLERLSALDAIDALNERVRRFQAQVGRLPRTVDELAAGVGIDRLPLVDPAGIAFVYDAGTGRFWFAQGSRYWRSTT